MPSTLDINRRIKSVKNTRQITRAMEKISAIKMRKSQAATLKSRRYASLAWEMLRALEGNIEKSEHPLLKERVKDREIKRVGYIVISPERGLCGSISTKLLQELTAHVRGNISGGTIGSEKVRWYTIGKKVRDGLVRAGAHLEGDFSDTLSATPLPSHSVSVIQLVVKDYCEGKIDALYMGWTDFVNTLVQKTVIKKLLPFNFINNTMQEEKTASSHLYTFEPSPEEVLENMLARILQLQVYQAMLESHASEHSARMVAMKNASENAGELIGDLTLQYNQIRQAGITREIAEISAGRIALEA